MPVTARQSVEQNGPTQPVQEAPVTGLPGQPGYTWNGPTIPAPEAAK